MCRNCVPSADPPYPSKTEIAQNLHNAAQARIIAILKDEYERSGAVWKFKLDIAPADPSPGGPRMEAHIDSKEQAALAGPIFDAMMESLKEFSGNGGWWVMQCRYKLHRQDTVNKGEAVKEEEEGSEGVTEDEEAVKVEEEDTTPEPAAPAPSRVATPAPASTRPAVSESALISRALKAALALSSDDESFSVRCSTTPCSPEATSAKRTIIYPSDFAYLGSSISDAVKTATKGMGSQDLVMEVIEKKLPLVEEWAESAEPEVLDNAQPLESEEEKLAQMLEGVLRERGIEGWRVNLVPITNGVHPEWPASVEEAKIAWECDCPAQWGPEGVEECFHEQYWKEGRCGCVYCDWDEETDWVLCDFCGQCPCECEWDEGQYDQVDAEEPELAPERPSGW
ncbi:hypothetical protein FN846DRAFT_909763 [Sphaerosporella brunnea]|uniref:Uncharacterized protein n=1 Tax=Sphaerosporella brunnea TaxID=1250544 RepID=A0A5J5ENT7_9PEZI|nr:hypothetical protein FN846DRAFT_909763 [Sphaerosporella brunnea]